MAWFDHLEDYSHTLLCDGREHRLVWRRGALVAADHEDLDAERAVVALGGVAPACVTVADLWEAAAADGGFIEEWSNYLHADSRRLWWLKTALERMRSEGVQDFLYDLPSPRARVMVEATLALPHPLLDRAAAHFVATSRPDPRTSAHIARAIRLRARRAFVESLATTKSHVRSAALVPFTCHVAPGGPSVRGALAGRHSFVDVSVDQSWLANVWGRGVAVLDGYFTLDVHETPFEVTARQLRWEGSERLVPTIVEVPIDFGR